MPVQPHARKREPFLGPAANWRWPRFASADATEPADDGSRAIGSEKLRVRVLA